MRHWLKFYLERNQVFLTFGNYDALWDKNFIQYYHLWCNLKSKGLVPFTRNSWDRNFGYNLKPKRFAPSIRKSWDRNLGYNIIWDKNISPSGWLLLLRISWDRTLGICLLGHPSILIILLKAIWNHLLLQNLRISDFRAYSNLKYNVHLILCQYLFFASFI